MASKNEKKPVRTTLKVVVSVSTLLILFLVIAFLIGKITGATIFSGDEYELTDNDVLAIKDFTGSKISVMGVKIGDPYQEVIKKIGRPDVQQLHPPNVINWEYSKNIDTDGSGLLIHMESGIVTSITIKKPFNKYLEGDSRVDGIKEDVYRRFGKPDRLKINYPFTYYYYDNKGFDVILDAGKINGYTFRF